MSPRTPRASADRPLSHGLVVGKFYPPHAGHLNLVRHALSRCRTVTVEVLSSSAESLPGELRAAWLRELLPTARVVHGVDDLEVDYASEAAWQAHVGIMRDLLDPADGPVDAVFTSDSYGDELAARLDATWVRVDPSRLGLPVSARAVRADPAGHWWALPAPVRAWYVRRVVVLGAESTGTTTLSRVLAARYSTPWVAEYGRQWSQDRPGGLDAPWVSAEFDLIAQVQAGLEDEAARRSPVPLLVTDTDVLATAVWHERYVGSRSATVEALAARRRPDLYILTGDDIPFVQDGLRDGEHIRHDMHARFREVLSDSGVPWIEVRGDRARRLAAATAAVDALVERPRELSAPLPEHHVGACALGSTSAATPTEELP